jgi:hypothetical protein
MADTSKAESGQQKAEMGNPESGFEVNAADVDPLTAALDAAEKADLSRKAESGNPRSGLKKAEMGKVPEDKSLSKGRENQARDDAGKFKGENAESGKQKAEIEKGAETEKGADNNKSRFQKEQERRDQSWKKLNEEKAALQKEREAWLKEKAANHRGTETPSAEEPKYSPEEYEAAASHFEKQGRLDLADAARETAKKLKAESGKQKAEIEKTDKAPAAADAEFEATQRAAWDKAKTEFPDILKTGTELNAEYSRILKESPALFDSPAAPYIAARLARGEIAARKTATLEQAMEKAQARIKELEELTTIDPGGVTREPSEKSWEDTSTAEQEKWLKQNLAAA